LVEIFVDADACPVKEEVIRVADRHRLAVHMVGNSWMRLDGATSVNRVVVPEGFDAADNWIAEHVGAGDIAITADIRLAARCLARGARVLGPTGKPFTEAGIGMALAMRDLNEYLRDAGEIRGGGPAFSRQDRSRFLEALEQTIQSLKRERPSS
jgi:uncharacterized protein YaiI (UPF0178 family)